MEAGYLAFLWVGRHILGFYYVRGTPVINPWTGEAHQPWLTTHLGEGYSYSRPTSSDLAGTVSTCWTMEAESLAFLWVGRHILGFYYVRGTPVINRWTGEAHQPWLTTHLGEGYSYSKPTAREPCLHCLSLLDHGGWISCFSLPSVRVLFSDWGVPALSRWLSTTFIKVVVDIMTSGLPQICKLVWSKQWHAPWRTSGSSNPDDCLLLWAPTTRKFVESGTCLPLKGRCNPSSWC